ncbi:MAG: aromatic amino acid transport family protein, partial [Bacillota bacterium]|nr:aromatic amino acid transport family protein [Bacillota bacterium]
MKQNNRPRVSKEQQIMKHQKLIGSLLFTGTFVGAGILGLPFALSQSGFIGGTIIFIIGTFFAYLTAVYVS